STLAILMFIAAGVIHFNGKGLGANKKEWTSLLVKALAIGGIIALLIFLLAPYIILMFLNVQCSTPEGCGVFSKEFYAACG
ncbi:MAG: hypothetical protein NT157_02140, partial [Candidatus Micrarchaeota archaeon]|nr:hypothetical protein [Candidatus Micrarchaeota archaeon]